VLFVTTALPPFPDGKTTGAPKITGYGSALPDNRHHIPAEFGKF